MVANYHLENIKKHDISKIISTYFSSLCDRINAAIICNVAVYTREYRTD